MSTIVKIRNKKSGIVYAYEQTARWDPDKGQSRPVRKYLGRYDEETDTIIPSSGRRGRKPSGKAPEVLAPSAPTASDDELRRRYGEALAENERMRDALGQALAALREATAAVEALLGASS